MDSVHVVRAGPHKIAHTRVPVVVYVSQKVVVLFCLEIGIYIGTLFNHQLVAYFGMGFVNLIGFFHVGFYISHINEIPR